MTAGFQIFRDDFWDRITEPRGYDPYDSHTAMHRDDGDIVEAMERAWKACCQASPEPLLILLSAGFMAAYYEHLATPDRGHEFEPYARA